ncbi:hypothetical protein ACT6QG_06260 [Xanthobacter sp. TB0136]|uniref:hypothetical protein n=1 Tax=Xanthobacter sp. TB0136 TaxID=3459177 RepID=UPI004039A8F8
MASSPRATSRFARDTNVHLDAALVIAADQVAAEIARLLDGGELLSMKQVKRARYAESVKAFAEA